MVSEVRFFSAPYSRPNRSFPIGDLTKYLVHTIADMKTSPDMEQILHVPEFDNWDTVNLVQVMDTSYVYWVRASTKRTDKKGQIAFDLLFNAVTSLITEGDVLKGVWDRLPTNENPYLKEVINTDAMEIFRTEPLPKLPFFMSQIFWYEIVLKQEIDKTSGQRLTRYGGFALAPFNSTNNSEEFVVCDVVTTSSRFRGYPSFHRIMNDFASIADNASTDKIVGINVSVRCPYKWIQTSSGDARIDLVNRNNQKIEPKIYKDTGLPSGADWVLYELETTEDDSPVPWSENVTITLTENELKYGAVNIINESGIIINEIPNELFKDGWMDVRVTTVSDYTGIYTDLEFWHNRIRIPEGKLPWVGDAWSEYQIRSMDTDRESLELSINNAREQRNIDALMSLSNAGMSSAMGFAMGGPIGAAGLGLLTAGTGIVGSHLQGQLSERTAKAEQEIREKHQKHQLSNNYDTAYGMIYLLDNNFNSLMIATSMPANLSSQMINDHVEEFGYRTEGVRSVEVGDGRYQGRLIDIPTPGPKGDMLNAEFIEGVKVTCNRLVLANCSNYFYGDESLIVSPPIDASACTTVYRLFGNCENLEVVKPILTPNTTNFKGMFQNCKKLTSIPDLDTSNATDMSQMFSGCSSLTSIPDLDTSNVTNMASMFSACSSLTSIPDLDTSNAANMYSMFSACSSLTSIPDLDTSNATNTHLMFNGCSSLTSITFVGNVVTPYGPYMFSGTPIASGNGYIFVPDSLVQAYRTAEGWSTHASVIKGISEK